VDRLAIAIAHDIVARLADLMRVLGLSKSKQTRLAKSAGVRPESVSGWMTGKHRPTWSRLKEWAEREGWPVAIFAEGGPMPSAVVPPLRLRSGDTAVTGVGDTEGSLPAELAQMIARDVGLAITRAVRQAHLDQSRAGLERLADTLLSLAVHFADNGDDNAEILRAVQRVRAMKLPG
jgi:transcriptional regulator with XRE-family HTH domain